MASAQNRALAFAAILILMSMGFVVAAAASTTSALAPFRTGAEYPLERPLSRHGTVLAVFVGRVVDDAPERVHGGSVTLTRADASAQPVASQATDRHGRALFEVPRGLYRIEVRAGDANASKVYDLGRPLRVAVVFDSANAPHWLDVDHRTLEHEGDTATLLVHVGHHRGGDAAVSIYRTGDGRALVANRTTGPRGNAVFLLPGGTYEVVATLGPDTARSSVEVRHDMRVVFVDDASGLHAAGMGGHAMARRQP